MLGENIVNSYARFDINADHGAGCLLYDDKGREYLDFVSGVAVNCLGHCHPAVVKAVREQSCKLMHVSNLYWNEQQLKLAEKLCSLGDFQGVFFCNSGTEAVESAVKFARKYGRLKGGELKHVIIYTRNSFHGRTLGALSITGQEKYRKDFMPLVPGVKSIEFNDADQLNEIMDSSVCAVIIEPVQGEGGIVTAREAFLQEARKLCDRYEALLVFDEVQCGIGRLGSFYAFERFGVKPDIVCIGKGLGGGFPIGAAVVSRKVAESISPGDHGSTFGGNPLACAAALAVIKELLENGVLKNVGQMSLYFMNRLQALKGKHNAIEEVRGVGLLIGLKLSIDARVYIDKCIEKGLLLAGAGGNVVRLLPPLNIEAEYLDRAADIIDSALEEFSESA